MKLNTKARMIWDEIVFEDQNRIPDNVWCSSCATSVRMTNISGEIVEDCLLLSGSCDVCGSEVKRLVES